MAEQRVTSFCYLGTGTEFLYYIHSSVTSNRNDSNFIGARFKRIIKILVCARAKCRLNKSKFGFNCITTYFYSIRKTLRLIDSSFFSGSIVNIVDERVIKVMSISIFLISYISSKVLIINEFECRELQLVDRYDL